MAAGGRVIQLCKVRESVCKGVVFICEILGGLWLVVNELMKCFFVRSGNGNYGIPNFYFAAFYGLYFIDGNHITLVYSAYQVRWYQLFQLAKALQCHNLFAGSMNAQIVPHALNVENIIDHDFFESVFCFYENKIQLFFSNTLA